jgi:hypothetical protein
MYVELSGLATTLKTQLLDTCYEILTPLDHHARQRPPHNR